MSKDSKTSLMMRNKCLVDRCYPVTTNGSWSWSHKIESPPAPWSVMTAITAHVCHYNYRDTDLTFAMIYWKHKWIKNDIKYIIFQCQDRKHLFWFYILSFCLDIHISFQTAFLLNLVRKLWSPISDSSPLIMSLLIHQPSPMSTIWYRVSAQKP